MCFCLWGPVVQAVFVARRPQVHREAAEVRGPQARGREPQVQGLALQLLLWPPRCSGLRVPHLQRLPHEGRLGAEVRRGCSLGPGWAES